jgi:hypothetical protein
MQVYWRGTATYPFRIKVNKVRRNFYFHLHVIVRLNLRNYYIYNK